MGKVGGIEVCCVMLCVLRDSSPVPGDAGGAQRAVAEGRGVVEQVQEVRVHRGKTGHRSSQTTLGEEKKRRKEVKCEQKKREGRGEREKEKREKEKRERKIFLFFFYLFFFLKQILRPRLVHLTEQ